MPKLTVDGIEVDVPEGATILQACEAAGVEIPIFCYHPKLSVAGNCRMCLVEVEKSPKPVASCSIPAGEGMVVKTTTEKVEKARGGVLELLLINHPLDCPICDQGGECDLQDITMYYGRDSGRFDLNKRAVADKHMGPLIKTIMTRCIHCTRCVRFADEIAGTKDMGALYRGEHMEITTYLEQTAKSELSGNMIDICPVGALTSKPYAFHGRPWELRKVETICALDAVGSNIRVDASGKKIMRILPRQHEAINEDWISDRTRFAYDGLANQRLDKPYLRTDGKLRPCSWDEAYKAIQKTLSSVSGKEIAAIAGDQADCETMLSLKLLFEELGSQNIDCRQDGAQHNAKYRSSYIFNTTIAGIEDSDLALLVGTNPRIEAAIINARLRKRYLQGGYHIALIGEAPDLNYPYEHLGTDAQALKDILDGKSEFAAKLKAAKKPMIILGQGAMVRRDAPEILRLTQEICDKYGIVTEGWNGFNMLHTAAARVGGLDIGFVPDQQGLSAHQALTKAEEGKLKLLYLLGADELPEKDLSKTFVVYQGHHGDRGAHLADVILPGATYTEKYATYVNTEGRPQSTNLVVHPPGEAKEDWVIIAELAQTLGFKLPYSDLGQLRQKLADISATFGQYDVVHPAAWQKIPQGTPETLSHLPLKSAIESFYMVDPITRHSRIMAECIEANAAMEPNKKAVANG